MDDQTDTPQPNVLPPTPPVIPPTSSASKRSPLILILLALIILILFAAGGYYLGSSNLMMPQPIASPVVYASPQPMASVDPTAGWKTFTSSKFNYSFKYPADWEFMAYDEENAVFGAHVLQSVAGDEVEKYMDHGIIDFQKLGKPIVKLQISYTESVYPVEFTNENDSVIIKNQEEHINAILNQENESAITEQELARQPQPDVSVGTLQTVQLLGDNSSKYFSVYLGRVSNKQLISVGVRSENFGALPFDQSESRKIVNQILSTFRFGDDSTDTSGWKTYQDSQYNFELKYPEEYKIAEDKSGWPNATLLLYKGGQTYDLAVEVWNTESEYTSKYKTQMSLDGLTVKNYQGKFITLFNGNLDPTVDQIISTFKFL